MRRVLREPLLHFLLGGAALFALYARVGDDGAARPDRIVVTEARALQLAAAFERTWMRPPTPAELAGLVDDFVTEEVLYREAVALGLDRDDIVVRRRMRQKMEFLNDGLSDLDAPTDDELAGFLRTHAASFRIPERVSFAQIFIDPSRGEGPPAERARALLARLAAGDDVVGDSTLLPRRLENATASEIDGTFGEGFAAHLATALLGEWSGPIRSTYGLHLVRVSTREPGRMPPLDEVRAGVEREWVARRRERSRARFYDELRSRYVIEIQPRPLAASEAATP